MIMGTSANEWGMSGDSEDMEGSRVDQTMQEFDSESRGCWSRAGGKLIH